MNPLWALPLTLAFPILPWLSLSPLWVAEKHSAQAVLLLLSAALAADFWWGRPLGGFALLLVVVTGLIYWAEKRWPGDERTFKIAAVALSAALVIIYWSR